MLDDPDAVERIQTARQGLASAGVDVRLVAL